MSFRPHSGSKDNRALAGAEEAAQGAAGGGETAAGVELADGDLGRHRGQLSVFDTGHVPYTGDPDGFAAALVPFADAAFAGG